MLLVALLLSNGVEFGFGGVRMPDIQGIRQILYAGVGVCCVRFGECWVCVGVFPCRKKEGTPDFVEDAGRECVALDIGGVLKG